jgi:predicted Zn-dependent protease
MKRVGDHRPGLALILMVTVAAASGCASGQRARVETALARTLISDEESNRIGEQVHAETERSGVRYVQDPAVRAYVEGVAERVFAVARSDRPGLDYHIHLIDDPRTVNAFAAPGGHLFVYSGLLLGASNEAEIAAVIGHEGGHIVQRHVERAIVNAYGLEALASAALGRNPGPAKELAAGVVGTGVMRAHSRSEETEADEYGVGAISSLGYDPRAMLTFLAKLQSGEGRVSGVQKWLSTHPLTPDRIAHLERYIRDRGLTGKDLGTQRLAAIKSRIPVAPRGA